MLEDVFLQIDIGWVAIIIAGISAIAVTGSLIMNGWETKKLADQRIAEMTINYNQTLSDMSTNVAFSKDLDEFNTHVSKYLNKLDELASLNNKGILSDKIADFFYHFIKDGYDTMKWAESVKLLKTPPHEKTYSDIIEWYKKNKDEKREIARKPIAQQAYGHLIKE